MLMFLTMIASRQKNPKTTTNSAPVHVELLQKTHCKDYYKNTGILVWFKATPKVLTFKSESSFPASARSKVVFPALGGPRSSVILKRERRTKTPRNKVNRREDGGQKEAPVMLKGA
jgi:hypothetical protein